MICCQYAAGGGGIVAVVFAAAAAIEGAEWVLARVWWIAGWSAVVVAVAVVVAARLGRWARARDTAPVALWRPREPGQLYAEPVTELPRAERQAIEYHVHHHYADPEPEPARASVVRHEPVSPRGAMWRPVE